MRSELARVSPRLGGLGRRIHWLDTASSTNDIAARLAELGAEEGTVVVADAQTAGRGRLGRVWFSAPGAGLYASIVLRLVPGALLTLASGVALAEGVEASTGLPAELKWPNDLMVGKRKLAGILAEASARGAALQYIVLGFGLNLRPVAYPPELADRATSVEAEIDRPADRALILAEVLVALAARYADLQGGRFDVILSAWRQRASSSLSGAPVEWDAGNGVVRGRAEDIDESGALLVRVGGRIERVTAGEVRWVR